MLIRKIFFSPENVAHQAVFGVTTSVLGRFDLPVELINHRQATGALTQAQNPAPIMLVCIEKLVIL
jgi:hypothetical protein